MPTFMANMRVTHIETWEVEADDEDTAREEFNKRSENVAVDESGRVDWEIQSICRGE